MSPSLDDFGEICFPHGFSFAFNLRKQNVTHCFYLFNTKLSPRRINGGLSDNGCASVPLASATSRP